MKTIIIILVGLSLVLSSAGWCGASDHSLVGSWQAVASITPEGKVTPILPGLEPSYTFYANKTFMGGALIPSGGKWAILNDGQIKMTNNGGTIIAVLQGSDLIAGTFDSNLKFRFKKVK